MLYRCLKCGGDFSVSMGYAQCPKRDCRSYETISHDQIDELIRLKDYFIKTTQMGIFPTLDAISSVFHKVGLRKFSPENTMKLVRLILEKVEAKGEVSFGNISVGGGAERSHH